MKLNYLLDKRDVPEESGLVNQFFHLFLLIFFYSLKQGEACHI